MRSPEWCTFSPWCKPCAHWRDPLKEHTESRLLGPLPTKSLPWKCLMASSAYLWPVCLSPASDGIQLAVYPIGWPFGARTRGGLKMSKEHFLNAMRDLGIAPFNLDYDRSLCLSFRCLELCAGQRRNGNSSPQVLPSSARLSPCGSDQGAWPARASPGGGERADETLPTNVAARLRARSPPSQGLCRRTWDNVGLRA